jgi:DNA-binding NarL/FixJ family response regulator
MQDMTSPIRVAVAESNPFIRAGITRLLAETAQFVPVLEAATGAEVIRHVCSVPVDVILVDEEIRSPGCVDVARLFRMRGVAGSILVTLVNVQETLVYNLMEEGVRGFVAKNDDPVTLFAAIEAVSAGEDVWLSPRVSARLVGSNSSKPSSMLSARERRLLHLMAAGKSNRAIAEELFLSVGTVRNKISFIYEKLGVSSRPEAMAWAWRNKFTHPATDDMLTAANPDASRELRQTETPAGWTSA